MTPIVNFTGDHLLLWIWLVPSHLSCLFTQWLMWRRKARKRAFYLNIHDETAYWRLNLNFLYCPPLFPLPFWKQNLPVLSPLSSYPSSPQVRISPCTCLVSKTGSDWAQVGLLIAFLRLRKAHKQTRDCNTLISHHSWGNPREPSGITATLSATFPCPKVIFLARDCHYPYAGNTKRNAILCLHLLTIMTNPLVPGGREGLVLPYTSRIGMCSAIGYVDFNHLAVKVRISVSIAVVKMGVNFRGQIWKKVPENCIFWSKIGSGFGEWSSHFHSKMKQILSDGRVCLRGYIPMPTL